jgi:type I restriction enzyme S subunit
MSDWITMRLGDLISIKHGYAFKGEFFSEDSPGPLLLTPGNFSIGGGFKAGKPKYYLGPIPDEFRLEGGELVITMTDLSKAGDTLGYPAIIPSGPMYLHNQRIGLVTIKDHSKIDKFFLFYALRTSDYHSHILAGASGSTVRHTSPGRISDYAFSMPGLGEQQAISAVLCALDDKIAVNDRIAETSLELALARYEAAVLGREYNRVVSMAESARWFSGGTPNTSEDAYWGGDIPWISALSLKSPWIDDSDRKVTNLGAENGTRLVPKDTVLFVVRGSSLDTEFRIGLTQREVAFGQDCKALRAENGIDPCVLFIAIKSRTSEILQVVDHTGHGAGRLSTDLLAKVALTLPGPHKSAAAAAELRALVDIGAVRRVENRNLQVIRNTLLPRLMSGEIRVRDAEKIVEDLT